MIYPQVNDSVAVELMEENISPATKTIHHHLAYLVTKLWMQELTRLLFFLVSHLHMLL